MKSAYSIRIYISTHTLTWSVTIENLVVPIVSRYFNSHAHVERDHVFIFRTNIQNISTHTLTWSVTLKTTGIGRLATDFNSHAHVERDLSTQPFISRILVFQLTRSRGA